MTLALWTLAIALVTAAACSLCGTFLVLKREALVSEGLSHAVLPGIVVAFVLLHDRSSPLLIVGAAASGLLMVLCVQALRRTRLVAEDASLGIVFPALFSVGILLASRELRGVHFHAHCIIDGNLALAPLDRLVVLGRDLGPQPFWVMTGALVVVATFVATFFKELTLLAFDEEHARGLGFRPATLHVAWLGMVSLTTVAAFETAGSILVVALMIAPAAAAVLLCDSVPRILAASVALGAASALGGFGLGLALDVAPSGPMASVSGGLFLAALALAPKRGLLARARRRRRQRARWIAALAERRAGAVDQSS